MPVPLWKEIWGQRGFLESNEPGFLIGESLKNISCGDLHFAIQLEYYWNVSFSCHLHPFCNFSWKCPWFPSWLIYQSNLQLWCSICGICCVIVNSNNLWRLVCCWRVRNIQPNHDTSLYAYKMDQSRCMSLERSSVSPWLPWNNFSGSDFRIGIWKYSNVSNDSWIEKKIFCCGSAERWSWFWVLAMKY